MTVRTGARRWGRGRQSCGAAIMAVLLALACDATLPDRMAAAGAASDLWGPSRPRAGGALGDGRWERNRGSARSFSGAGTGR